MLRSELPTHVLHHSKQGQHPHSRTLNSSDIFLVWILCYFVFSSTLFHFFFSVMEWLYFLLIKFQRKDLTRKNYHNPRVRWIFFSQ